MHAKLEGLGRSGRPPSLCPYYVGLGLVALVAYPTLVARGALVADGSHPPSLKPYGLPEISPPEGDTGDTPLKRFKADLPPVGLKRFKAMVKQNFCFP